MTKPALCRAESDPWGFARPLFLYPFLEDCVMFRNTPMTTRAIFAVVLALVLVGLVVTPAQAGDKEDIVGRWDHSTVEGVYIRFYADGTFKEVALLNRTEGNYRLIGLEVIEVDIPGLIYGRNRGEMKYRLSGDTLELKVFGEWVKYKRVK